MTLKDYKKHTIEFYRDKHVTTNATLHCGMGIYILKNEICRIRRKWKGFEIINAGGIVMSKVEPHYLDPYDFKI